VTGATAPKACQLLDFDFTASLFQLLLGGICFRLGSAFEHGLRGALNQRLGFCQSETGLDLANSLDDGDLFISRHRSEDHVKRVLGLSRGSSTSGSAASSSCYSHGSRGSNAPLFFQLFYQVCGFENRQLAQFLYEVV